MILKFGCVAWLLAWVVLELFNVVFLFFIRKTTIVIVALTFAFFLVLFRKTNIYIDDDMIYIKRINCSKEFLVNSFVEFEEKRKIIGYDFFHYIYYKRYLIFRDENGKVAVRLYDYARKDAEKIINILTKQKKTCQDSVDENYINMTCFKIESYAIKTREIKGTLKRGMISFLCLVAIIIMLLTCTLSPFFQLFLFGMGIFYMVITIFTPIKLWCIKQKYIPSKWVCYSNELYVDQHHFDIAKIKRVKMTSIDKKTHSMFPTQYNIEIDFSTSKFKFYLGSEYSFSDYGKFCLFVENELFSNHRDLIEYRL